MPGLFEPLAVRGVQFPNRIAVSPMCQYSSRDGFANDWHFVHLASRAVGGAGLVFTEATAVLPEGRISPYDLGIWDEAHIPMLARITHFVAGQGAVPGIQLAHAGRKGGTGRPWEGGGAVASQHGGWTPVAPGPAPFDQGYPVPQVLGEDGIARVVAGFRQAAERALGAGFQVVEVHAAHGYLLHEFLSPLSNPRGDRYGGSFDNRVRLLGEVVEAIRSIWPERLPLFVRISATDWVDGGWAVEDSVDLARRLASLGVDLVDCSSGGNVAGVRIPLGPGYQTGFSQRIRREAGVLTGAVGLITEPAQADHIVRTGQADLVLLARELLRDPYWPLRAARVLGVEVPWPPQYLRAAPSGSPSRGARAEAD